MIGNGFCNEETNNANCKYDGGDCCLNLHLVGNGFCNDEANNIQCRYDNGDCCGSISSLELCSECICYMPETCVLLESQECEMTFSDPSGVIISPGFPTRYKNHIDWTWLIQFPLENFIEIIFLSFQLEFHATCK